MNTVVSKGKYDSGLADLLFGSRGECKIEDLESDKDFCIGIFSDGAWEARKNDIGTFSYQKHEFEVPYLKEPGYLLFEMALPKIPYGMLLGIVEFYKKIMVKLSNAEAMVQVWWNKEEQKYQLYVPKQKVSGASVKFDHSEELQNDDNMVWVLDTHSHNTMGAFFSGGDDADEKSTRVFGVIGQLNREPWASKWRAGCNGQYVDLDMEILFDKDNDELVSIPDSQLDKVEKNVYTARTVVNGRAVSANRPLYGYGGYGAYGGYGGGSFGSDFPYGYSAGGKQPQPYRGDYWNRQGYSDEINDFYDNAMSEENKSDFPFVTEDLELDELFTEFEEMNEASAKGLLESANLAAQARSIVDYLTSYTEFDNNVATAIIDQLSANMKQVDFDSTMTLYLPEA